MAKHPKSVEIDWGVHSPRIAYVVCGSKLGQGGAPLSCLLILLTYFSLQTGFDFIYV